MTKILVIQHSPSEGLGRLEEEIRAQNLSYETLKTYEGPVFPSGVELEGFGALIILGGPMAVYEGAQYPWMKRELLVIREAMRQKKPILGICLGAQLLAHAAGARVFPGGKKEIGWGQIRFDDWFSKRNPLTFQMDLAKPHRVFQWHGDTFDFPVEGYRLAWNDTYPSQMFCIQGNAIGIQFHPEVTFAMIEDWVKNGEREILSSEGDPQLILEDSRRYLPDLEKMCHRFFYGFASLIRDNVRRPIQAAG